MKIEKIIDKISKLTIREVESEELQQPIAKSYEDIIQELSLYVEDEFRDEALKIVKNSIAVLLQTRLEKILKKIASGEDVPKKLLYLEERKLIQIFEKIDQLFKKKVVEKVERVEKVESFEDLVPVCMRDSFPAIQTSRMERLGPFLKYDIVTLPTDDASELVKKGVVDVLRL